MTMPNERTSALLHTKEFLRSLLDPKKTPRVPRAIRIQAYWCLRHYPAEYQIKDIPSFAKDFGKLKATIP